MSKGLIAKSENSIGRHLFIAAIIGVVLTVGLIGYIYSSKKPVVDSPKNAIAFYDESKVEINNDTVINGAIGEMTFDKTRLDVLYKGDYSNLVDSISLEYGAMPSEIGIGYYEAFGNNIKGIKDEQITIKNNEGSINCYSFKDSFSVGNRDEVFLEKVNCTQGLVIFYQESGEYGFSSQYEALVFEEVK